MTGCWEQVFAVMACCWDACSDNFDCSPIWVGLCWADCNICTTKLPTAFFCRFLWQGRRPEALTIWMITAAAAGC